LYASHAVLFGTAEPMVFDGSEPLSAHYSGLAGTGNKVRIYDRRALPLREDAVLFTGSCRFEVTKNGVRVLLPSHYTMLIVKYEGNWKISYHTSSGPQPISEAAAGKGAQQASVAPKSSGDMFGQCAHPSSLEAKIAACTGASRATTFPWILHWVYRELG